MPDYNGVTWRVNYGELGELEQFRVGRRSLESFDAYFGIGQLVDLISTLTETASLGLGVIAKGVTVQTVKVTDGFVNEITISPRLDSGTPVESMRLRSEELPDLLYALSLFQQALASGTIYPDDWDTSKATRLTYDQLPRELAQFPSVLESIEQGGDGGYVLPAGGIPSTDLSEDVNTALQRAAVAYVRPETGIAKAELSAGVQTSLNKADTANEELTNGRLSPTAMANYASTSALSGLIPSTQKGQASGVAGLGADAKVPTAQLPLDLIANSAEIAAVIRAKAMAVINVLDYGAQGNNSSFDNLPAFNAAFAACVAAGGGTIYIPGGSYRLSGEWNIYRPNSPRIDITIRGESQYATKVFSNFYGADKSLIKSVDPAGNTRTSPTSITDIQFGTVSRSGGVNPCLVDLFGLGESRLESVRLGTSNNTHLRISSAQNVRMRDIVSFNASQHFNYRDTTGITFSSMAGTQELTSSADIFTANDTNRLISVFGTTVRTSYRILAYVNARKVTIAATTPVITISNGSAFFEPARGSMVAGQNRLTANAQVFSSNDVGRTIYIQGAKSGAYGPALLRAKITNYVSAASVDLDRTADNTINRVEFAVPAVDIWTPDVGGTAGAGSNDIKIDTLHIENYYGVGLVVQNSIFMHITDAKIHGEQTPTATAGSTSHMWLDDFGGTIGIDLDGTSTGAERIYVCNMNDLLTFEYLYTRNNFNDIVLAADTFTDAGGQVQVCTFNSYTEAVSGNPYDLISDPNANPKIIFVGLTSMLGDALLSRIYMGKDTYATVTGNIVTKTSNGTFRRFVINNDGTVTSSTV